MVIKKKCPQCKKIKIIKKFNADRVICKDCIIYQKKYRKQNKKRLLLQKKEYYKLHKNDIISKVIAYDKAHVKEKRKRQHKRYLICKEDKKRYNSLYYIANKYKICCQKKIYNRTHKEERNILTLKRRAIKRKVKENYNLEDKRITIKVFGGKCFNCGDKNDLCIDHHYCLQYRNALSIKNAVLLCRRCNSKKHTKSPKEFYTASKLKKLKHLFDLAKQLKGDKLYGRKY